MCLAPPDEGQSCVVSLLDGSSPLCPHSPWWRGLHCSLSPVISSLQRRSCRPRQKSLPASLRERPPQVRPKGVCVAHLGPCGANMDLWGQLGEQGPAHSAIMGLIVVRQFYFYLLNLFFLYS